MTKMQAEGKLVRNTHQWTIDHYGRCTRIKKDGNRCKKEVRKKGDKFCHKHDHHYSRRKPKVKSYRTVQRKHQYEVMKANRVQIAAVEQELSKGEHKRIDTLCSRYNQNIDGDEYYGEYAKGHLELLRQMIWLEAVEHVKGRLKLEYFRDFAHKHSTGDHDLTIRLADGSYATDDEFTLKRGTKKKFDMTADLGPDTTKARAIQTRKMAQDKDPGPKQVTYEDFEDADD